MAVPGRHPAEEALAAGRARRLLLAEGRRDSRLRALVQQAEAAGVPVEIVPPAELERLSAGARHQGVVALAEPYPTVELDDLLDLARRRGQPALLVVAAGVEDPRNLGAIARSAEGAGAHGLVVPARRAAPLSPTAAKAAAGALEHLPVAVVPNAARALDELKAAGIWIYGTDPAAPRVYWEVDWTAPAAIVIGGEGAGLSRLVRESCDELVRIPMNGRVSSLNASAAAAILLYEAVRQRALR
ncbi:MAG: 23S rRNA (guanosine(2251)-2'-O)-methyltransferase RlmB [Firmicutes bacterium]|nr:23S rRNA (guanosine(2251)-2'-O)-methyltransferase RlmB [Bacillota bacterium]